MHVKPAPGLPPLIVEIREQAYQRRRLHKAEKALTLQIKGHCRRLCGGDKDEAAVVYKAMMGITKKWRPGPHEHELAATALAANMIFLEMRSQAELARMATEMRLEDLAGQLPVSSWWQAIRGCNLLGLALIVGECPGWNDQGIGDFATVSKLWKRMGLAVMPDGTRQRRIAGDAAIEHGFAPSRRAAMWTIGQSLFLAQSQRVDKETGEVKREAGPYRVIYDERKAYEVERDPEIKPCISHARAKRFMEKRLLRNLWRAWREASGHMESTPELPPAEYPRAAE